MDFRYIAIEGPIAVGKCELTERLATLLNASIVLDNPENPFLNDFYEGRAGAAFQTQLFSLLARHRQQATLRQTDLFSRLTLSDYLFDKDKIYAYLNLDDNELFIYQRLYDVLAQDVVNPDLVIYLQSPTEVLRDRIRQHSRPDEPTPDLDYLVELNEAYNHFFFHYTTTPLLVVETTEFGVHWEDHMLEDLIKQLKTIEGGTQYYVPRTGGA